MAEGAGATAVVAKALEGVALTGVLNEVTALIPMVLPVAIGYLAIRKGISFVLSTIQNA